MTRFLAHNPAAAHLLLRSMMALVFLSHGITRTAAAESGEEGGA